MQENVSAGHRLGMTIGGAPQVSTNTDTRDVEVTLAQIDCLPASAGKAVSVHWQAFVLGDGRPVLIADVTTGRPEAAEACAPGGQNIGAPHVDRVDAAGNGAHPGGRQFGSELPRSTAALRGSWRSAMCARRTGASHDTKIFSLVLRCFDTIAAYRLLGLSCETAHRRHRRVRPAHGQTVVGLAFAAMRYRKTLKYPPGDRGLGESQAPGLRRRGAGDHLPSIGTEIIFRRVRRY